VAERALMPSVELLLTPRLYQPSRLPPETPALPL